MFRVSHQGEGIDDADTIEGVRGIVRRGGVGRRARHCWRALGDSMTIRCDDTAAAGPLRHRDVPGTIGVLEVPHRPMPIGMVFCTGWDGDGLAVWPLAIRGADMPGRWMKAPGSSRAVADPPQ